MAITKIPFIFGIPWLRFLYIIILASELKQTGFGIENEDVGFGVLKKITVSGELYERGSVDFILIRYFIP